MANSILSFLTIFAFTLGVLLHPYTHVSAETTLYIPGADEQPLSVQQLGTDGHGRTSWLVGPETPTGTFVDPIAKFTATLVEGPSDAVLLASVPGGPAFSYSCAIAGSRANCQLVAEDPVSTETTSVTETVRPFVVQGGGSFSSSSRIPSTLTSTPPTGTTTTPSPQSTGTSPNSAHTNHNHHLPLVWLLLGSIHTLYIIA